MIMDVTWLDVWTIMTHYLPAWPDFWSFMTNLAPAFNFHAMIRPICDKRMWEMTIDYQSLEKGEIMCNALVILTENARLRNGRTFFLLLLLPFKKGGRRRKEKKRKQRGSSVRLHLFSCLAMLPTKQPTTVRTMKKVQFINKSLFKGTLSTRIAKKDTESRSQKKY